MLNEQGDRELARGAGAMIGATGGVVGGLLGGGNGVVFVAGLDRFTRLPRALRHGTSTISNITVCAVGAAVYAIAGGAVDLHAGGGLILGGILGGFFGARLLVHLPNWLLHILLITILVLTAAKFYLNAAGLDPLYGDALVAAGLRANLWFVLPMTFLAGVVIGAWAGAMGLGGGLLAVPVLVLLFGVDIHTAEGTSLLMFVPNSIMGAVVHLRQKTAAPRVGGLVGLSAAPGAMCGALLGLALNSTVLGIVFATFTLGMAIRECCKFGSTTLTNNRRQTRSTDAG